MKFIIKNFWPLSTEMACIFAIFQLFYHWFWLHDIHIPDAIFYACILAVCNEGKRALNEIEP